MRPRESVTKQPASTAGGSPVPEPAAHRRRLQLHEALFRFPLGRHQAAPGEEGWGPSAQTAQRRSRRPPGPAPLSSRPRPAAPPRRPALSQALHALLSQQPPELLATLAQPLGLGRRAIGEEVLGAVRPLGQLLGPRAGGEELRGAGGEGDTRSAPRIGDTLPGSGPRFSSSHTARHLSTRPAGTSTAAGSGSGSIWPPSTPARAFYAPPAAGTPRGPSASR